MLLIDEEGGLGDSLVITKTLPDHKAGQGVYVAACRSKRVLYNLNRLQGMASIAHELGHWEMHPYLNQLQACIAADVYAYRGSSEELEANAFAAEFLMPDFMLNEQLRYLSPTLNSVKRLADRFTTSVTATAVRMCEYSNLPMVVAFCAGGRLRWYRRSPRAKDYFFLRIGSELDGDSLARYCTDSLDDPSEPVEVHSGAWFPDDWGSDRFKVLEESVELGSYNTTLSIVTVDD